MQYNKTNIHTIKQYKNPIKGLKMIRASLHYSEVPEHRSKSMTIATKKPILSKSELAVVKLIYLPNKVIADILFISVETVKTHIQNIRKKIQCPSKLDVALWAVKNGLIEELWKH